MTQRLTLVALATFSLAIFAAEEAPRNEDPPGPKPGTQESNPKDKDGKVSTPRVNTQTNASTGGNGAAASRTDANERSGQSASGQRSYYVRCGLSYW